MPDTSIAPVRGTLILADDVLRAESNKWVICGTYNAWVHGLPGDLQLPSLQFYYRILPEGTGTLQIKFTIEQSNANPADSVIGELEFEREITEKTFPVFEDRICINGVMISRPPETTGAGAQRGAGRLRFVLMVKDGRSDEDYLEIASCPMIIIFKPC